MLQRRCVVTVRAVQTTEVKGCALQSWAACGGGLLRAVTDALRVHLMPVQDAPTKTEAQVTTEKYGLEAGLVKVHV